MSAERRFTKQLLEDLDRLHDLILRYAGGDRSAKTPRDRLEGAVQIKFAFWRSLLGRPRDPDDAPPG